MPPLTGAVRTGHEQTMQYRKKNGSFHIELELPVCQKPAEDLPDPQLLPEPLEDEGRTDLLRCGIHIALAGKNQKNLLGKPGQGAHQVFDLTLVLNLIHPADGCNHPLDGLLAFPAILDDLKVLVLTGCLDSREHGGPP